MPIRSSCYKSSIGSLGESTGLLPIFGRTAVSETGDPRENGVRPLCSTKPFPRLVNLGYHRGQACGRFPAILLNPSRSTPPRSIRSEVTRPLTLTRERPVRPLHCQPLLRERSCRCRNRAARYSFQIPPPRHITRPIGEGGFCLFGAKTSSGYLRLSLLMTIVASRRYCTRRIIR
jgi:hypothetical protein